MTYKINGVELTTQPTGGSWMPRRRLGVDGAGHSVYPATYDYEMRWQLQYPVDFQQLWDFYNTISVTGTVVVDLPAFATGTYEFCSYTGCIVHEPEMREYFNQHHADVFWLVSNIRT